MGDICHVRDQWGKFFSQPSGLLGLLSEMVEEMN
jgi:hypothetical protein